MKKIAAAIICMVFLLNLLPVTASTEPRIVSCGFVTEGTSVISALDGEGTVRGFADIVNYGFVSSGNIGKITVECYADGELCSTTETVLTIDENTLTKRFVTPDITVPSGDYVSIKIYVTDTSGVKILESEISNSLELPGAENDGEWYAREIDIMKAFNVMSGYEDGSFGASKSVTRAEFAAVLTRLLGKTQAADLIFKSQPTGFSDVNETHWARGYVNVVVQMGYMSGLEGGIFAPDSRITLYQATESLVRSLGYVPELTSLGLIEKALSLGILSNISYEPNEYVSRGALAKLLFNTVDLPFMEQTGFGTYIDYTLMDGTGYTYKKSHMSENLGIVRVNARVIKSYELENTAKSAIVQTEVYNSFGSKYADYDYADDRIFDDTVDINVGGTNLKSYVGRNAEIFIKYDENSNSEPTAVYVEGLAFINEITINLDNIDDVWTEGNVVMVKYFETYEATKTKIMTIQKRYADVYVNGYLESIDVQAALGCFFYGTATFALSNSYANEDYDTLFIKDYTNMVVGEVDLAAGKILPKKGNIGAIIFNPANTDCISTLTDKEGNRLDWSVLKENDVLSVQKFTFNQKVVSTCTLVTDTVTGMITEIGSDGYGPEYRIAGNDYKIDNQIVYEGDLAFGDEGTFYLDIMGRITYFEMPVSRNYASVIAVGLSGGIEVTTDITMFTYEGEVVTLSTMQKVKVSYYNVYEGYVTHTLYSDEIASIVMPGDLIKFELYYDESNDEYLISEIEMPDKSGEAGGRNFFKFGSDENANYNAKDHRVSLGGRSVYLKDDTLIMAVPNDLWVEEDYALIPFSALSSDCVLPNVSAYDVNENLEASCIVIQGLSGLDFGQNNIAVFKETTENGITVMQNGTEATLELSGGFVPESSFGNIVFPQRDIHGKVSALDNAVTVDFSADLICVSDWYGYFAAGNVSEKSGRVITLSSELYNGQFYIPETANIYVCDERLGILYAGGLDSFDVSVDSESGEIKYSTACEGSISSIQAVVGGNEGAVTDVVFYIFGDEYTPEDTEINLVVTSEFAASNTVFTNDFGRDINAPLVLARYNGGKLMGFTRNMLSLSQNMYGMFKCSMSGQFNNGETIKSILLEDLNSLMPLKDTVSEVVAGADCKSSPNAVTVAFDDISEATNQTVCYNGGTLNLSGNPLAYINGKRTAFSPEMLNNFYGEVTFFDYANNKYNSLYITDYANTVVSHVNTATGHVVAKKGIDIPFGGFNSFGVLRDKEGTALEWSSLSENDVVSTRVISKGELTVYLSTLVGDTVVGTVTNNESGIRIDGNTYETDGVIVSDDDLMVNDSGDFYLDILGRIANFDLVKEPSCYGYVLAVGLAGGIEDITQIKMLTSNGETDTFDTASAVRLSYYDGSQYTTLSNVPSRNLLDSQYGYCISPNSLIAFTLNSEGDISHIMLPDVSKEGIKNTRNFAKYSSAHYSLYCNNNQSFKVGSKIVFADQSTVIMQAPLVQQGIYYEDDYRIIPLEMFADDYELEYIMAYDVDSDGVASLIVISSVPDLCPETGIAMVVKFSQAKNDEGDTVDKATVLQNANSNDFNTIELFGSSNPNNELSDLSEATVLAPKFNFKGEVYDYTVIAELDYYGNNVSFTLPADTYKVSYYAGEVASRKGARITLADDMDFTIPSTANVYVYASKGRSPETRVYAPDIRYNAFSSDSYGNLYDSDGDELSKVFVLVKEINDDIVDVVFYMFDMSR